MPPSSKNNTAQKQRDLIGTMSVLTDPTRLRLLRLLEKQELTVAELCAVTQLPQSTISRHLKILCDHHWTEARRESTSRLYRMAISTLPTNAQQLWELLRPDIIDALASDQEDQRLASILAQRQSRSQTFFSTSVGQWNKLRQELFGNRFDLTALLGLLNPTWTVADLGCGTGQLSEALSPFVKKVIAIDESETMLAAAKEHLTGRSNIQWRHGQLTQLPLRSGTVDAAMMSLALHHMPLPNEAIAEAARTLKPGGRFLLIDMLEHDRADYQQQMGHQWLGFSKKQIRQWFTQANLTTVHLCPLPIEPDARGPNLFVAIGQSS